MTISKAQVTVDGDRLVTEASTIGLAPGEWPESVTVLNERNEGLIFGPTVTPLEDGGWMYHSRTGQGFSLHILND